MVHSHAGVPPGQQLAHQTFEFRREMLDDDKGHPAILWHVVEEFLQRLQPPGGRPDADHVRAPLGGAAFGLRTANHILCNFGPWRDRNLHWGC